MPHILTGEIRKDVFTKDGGDWKLYRFELSESFKNRDGEREYTNYTVAMFASSEGMRNYYDNAIQRGKIISVMCENLKINQREADDGRVFVSLEPVDARIVFNQYGAPAGQGSTQQQNPRPTKADLAKSAQKQAQAQNAPPMDFDDDIPF